MCWNCKVGEYMVYDSDHTKTPRCGRCGELKQDDPQRIVTAKPKATPVRRAPAKTTKEKA